MSAKKVSRRDLMIGAASAITSSVLPLHAVSLTGDAQTSTPPDSQQPYISRRAGWMQDHATAGAS
jgi:hypothetical protein